MSVLERTSSGMLDSEGCSSEAIEDTKEVTEGGKGMGDEAV